MGWQRTCDLDGTPAGQVTFGIDGKAFVLDLGETEHAKLQKVLQRYLTVATPYGVLPDPPEFTPGVGVNDPTSTEVARPDLPAGIAPSVRGGRATSVLDPKPPMVRDTPQRVIRAWAQAHGYSVGPKGRIPEDIINRYYDEL